jgi:hypothetical protein
MQYFKLDRACLMDNLMYIFSLDLDKRANLALIFDILKQSHHPGAHVSGR